MLGRTTPVDAYVLSNCGNAGEVALAARPGGSI
jgi:hypothetical protein